MPLSASSSSTGFQSSAPRQESRDIVSSSTSWNSRTLDLHSIRGAKAQTTPLTIDISDATHIYKPFKSGRIKLFTIANTKSRADFEKLINRSNVAVARQKGIDLRGEVKVSAKDKIVGLKLTDNRYLPLARASEITGRSKEQVRDLCLTRLSTLVAPGEDTFDDIAVSAQTQSAKNTLTAFASLATICGGFIFIAFICVLAAESGNAPDCGGFGNCGGADLGAVDAGSLDTIGQALDIGMFAGEFLAVPHGRFDQPEQN